MQGWIKLHRQTLGSTVFQNANLFQVWSWCLLRANHTETKMLWNDKEVTLKPGQFIGGRLKGSEACNMKLSTFRNQITLLKKLGNLDTKSDSKYTLFTVVKWNQFQHSSELKDSEKDSQRTAEGHRQECNNEENVLVISKAYTALTENNIDGIEEIFKARASRLIKDYGIQTFKAGFSESIDSWIAGEKTGSGFCHYMATIFKNNY